MIDYSRHAGLIDHEVMARATLAGIGAGGAASLYRNLARAGIGGLVLVDYDHVSNTNPTTQAYGLHQCGQSKVEALAADIHRINPKCMVQVCIEKVEALPHAARQMVLNSNLILAMTDDFKAQVYLNHLACKNSVDTIFAAAYPGAVAVEITGSFTQTIKAGKGCHRCHTFSRYQAQARNYQKPCAQPSHIFQAEYLNALLGNLVISHLHVRANSSLGNAELARRFAENPLIISRLNPAFEAQPGAAFDSLPEALSTFPTIHWPRELPPGFKCADCGASPDITPDFV